MKLSLKNTILLYDLICSLLLVLFLYTGIQKLYDHRNFERVLFHTPLVRGAAGFISWALPLAELAIAGLLFFTAMRLKGLVYSLVLLSLLSFYLGYMIIFTPNRPCNCGGVLASMSWPQHIVFNLFFIAISVTGIILYKKHLETFKQTPP